MKRSNARAHRAPDPVVVLVVDDHDDHREIVIELLQFYGLRAIGARTAAEARSLWHAAGARAVVTDYAMPGEDGLALARWIRAQANGASVLLVVYTAEVDEQIARKVERIGGRVLQKPATPQQLVTAIAPIAAGKARTRRR